MADQLPEQRKRPSLSSDGSSLVEKIRYEKSWLHRHCSSVAMRDKKAKKSGQLFSGLLVMNVVFLGSALISSMIFNKVAITPFDVKVFLSLLMVLSSCWLLYYMLGTSRKPHAVLYRDVHAGAFWLRGSLVLFGTCSLMLAVFNIGFEVSRPGCESPINIIFPCLEIVFISLQTGLLWFYCKDCVQVQHTLTRYGLMLTLATDLLLWTLAVANDSIHEEIEYFSKSSNNQSSSCNCTGRYYCRVFYQGYLTLYPFNLEYNLIGCSMLYIMWENVGRRAAHHSTHILPRFRFHGVLFGPLLGIVVLLVGVCVFIFYQIRATSFTLTQREFVLYYGYHIALLPLMTMCSVAGTIIHSLEERQLDPHKNPTRSLDTILLLGSALGQFAISYYSIVAVVATDTRDLVNSLNLTNSVILIFQHIGQNIFIIEGLRKQPPGEGPPEGIKPRSTSIPSLRRASQIYLEAYSNLNWKRRAVKEIALFLILSNIILWIMPAFGLHPQFENGLEKKFYGESTWFAILNFGLPLAVFYRMHSVGGLLEVYLTA
ncbi:proton channel OTOP3 [Pleurodeles waltl]|uniref:proton channel OTOP3 n=1 Tax=Pleurodeles waltl TaxID=8319 RepID=UPI0037099D9F